MAGTRASFQLKLSLIPKDSTNESSSQRALPEVPASVKPGEFMREGGLPIEAVTMIQGGGRSLAASSPMQEGNKCLRECLR